MKKILFLLLGIFLITAAGAEVVTQDLRVNILENDVAYVYRRDFRIDQNIVEVFDEMGFDVVFINEMNITTANLSRFRFVFIGDENFRNSSAIKVNEFPFLIINYHHVGDWGLTDTDGASQLGGTAALSVRRGNQVTQVYTQAFRRDRISIPYYFLATENRADSLIQVAATIRTSSGDLGDVISYAFPGVELENGKIAEKQICYFGIVNSNFWTPAARELFEDCVRFVAG